MYILITFVTFFILACWFNLSALDITTIGRSFISTSTIIHIKYKYSTIINAFIYNIIYLLYFT